MIAFGSVYFDLFEEGAISREKFQLDTISTRREKRDLIFEVFCRIRCAQAHHARTIMAAICIFDL